MVAHALGLVQPQVFSLCRDNNVNLWTPVLTRANIKSSPYFFINSGDGLRS